MLSELWEVRKATRAVMKKERSYHKLIAEACRKKESQETIRDLQSEASIFTAMAWAERNKIITKSLCREAGFLNVPVPDVNDSEMWGEGLCHRALTDKGINALRKAIREERQSRGLYAKVIFSAIASTIAAIAAITAPITGLLAVCK